jgi:hypothetical protein
VVVAVGFTVWVPPVMPRVKVVLSDPEMVTAVAFVATTVRVEEAPGATEVGFAEIVTVAAAAAVTVSLTDAVAGVVPAPPVAVAVYVAVAEGVTDCDPPALGIEYVLPSDPVITTLAALAAVTFSTDDAPAATELGVAVRATVGAAVLVPDAVMVVPQPASERISGRKQVIRAAENSRELNFVGPRTFTCVSPDTDSAGVGLEVLEYVF